MYKIDELFFSNISHLHQLIFFFCLLFRLYFTLCADCLYLQKLFKNSFFFFKINLIPVESALDFVLWSNSWSNACTSSTMDGFSLLPYLHTNIRRNDPETHQSRLWPHSLQDVPEQAPSEGLSFRPDHYQYRHRTSSCEFSFAAACGCSSKEMFP